MLPDILVAIKENFLSEGTYKYYRVLFDRHMSNFLWCHSYVCFTVDAQLAGQILEQLALVDRFSIALNFMSSSQKHGKQLVTFIAQVSHYTNSVSRQPKDSFQNSGARR